MTRYLLEPEGRDFDLHGEPHTPPVTHSPALYPRAVRVRVWGCEGKGSVPRGIPGFARLGGDCLAKVMGDTIVSSGGIKVKKAVAVEVAAVEKSCELGKRAGAILAQL
ncbi:hypothetical protein J6590_002191 [Homalodisca vitripennis]|nr:hypothetical protein J6590_002191 [Homalodisca vitripennis]